ncbi:hypothetical protein WME94_26425 [Sorangium sp. So ce429]
MKIPAPPANTAQAFIAYIENANPYTSQIFKSSTEEEFCEAVDGAISHAIAELEEGARLMSNADERQLTFLLTKVLRSASIPATPEEYVNGHVDVTIRHPRAHPVKALGECKIYRGYEHHVDGCSQLIVRYVRAHAARVFCLEFFKQPRMVEKMNRLRIDFDARKPLDQVGESAAHDHCNGAFVTHHVHSSAAVIEVLHLCCDMHHAEAPPSE